MSSPWVSVRGCGASRFILTCEHASNVLPIEADEGDAAFLETHWGYDPGARQIAEAMCEALDGTLVCAEFSRLWVDPNRPIDHETWIRERAEGHTFEFNVVPDRRERYEAWQAFHRRVDEVVAECLLAGVAPVLFSVHTFVKDYPGEERPMEMGVLYDSFETAAGELIERLRRAGHVVASNEPYSGFDGLVYSVARHGAAHQIPYLEVEVRQDLVREDAAARAIGGELAEAWRAVAASL
jgi:predicted N-formylglutamate amidohydrolase